MGAQEGEPRGSQDGNQAPFRWVPRKREPREGQETHRRTSRRTAIALHACMLVRSAVGPRERDHVGPKMGTRRPSGRVVPIICIGESTRTFVWPACLLGWCGRGGLGRGRLGWCSGRALPVPAPACRLPALVWCGDSGVVVLALVLFLAIGRARVPEGRGRWVPRWEPRLRPMEPGTCSPVLVWVVPGSPGGGGKALELPCFCVGRVRVL